MKKFTTKIKESKITFEEFLTRSIKETKIESKEQFREWAETVLRKAHGDNFEPDIFEKIVSDLMEKYEGNFGAMVGALSSGLGESEKIEELRLPVPKKVDDIIAALSEDSTFEDKKNNLYKVLSNNGEEIKFIEVNHKGQEVGKPRIFPVEALAKMFINKNYFLSSLQKRTVLDNEKIDERKKYTFDDVLKVLDDKGFVKGEDFFYEEGNDYLEASEDKGMKYQISKALTKNYIGHQIQGNRIVLQDKYLFESMTMHAFMLEVIYIAAQYTDEDLEHLAEQEPTDLDDAIRMVLPYIPKKEKSKFTTEVEKFIKKYKLDDAEVVNERKKEEYEVFCYAGSYQHWSTNEEPKLKITDLEQAHEFGQKHCPNPGMWYTIYVGDDELTDERTANKKGKFVKTFENVNESLSPDNLVEIIFAIWDKIIDDGRDGIEHATIYDKDESYSLFTFNKSVPKNFMKEVNALLKDNNFIYDWSSNKLEVRSNIQKINNFLEDFYNLWDKQSDEKRPEHYIADNELIIYIDNKLDSSFIKSIKTLAKEHKINVTIKNEKIIIKESEITTEEQFREWAETVLRNAHGDNFDQDIFEKVVTDLMDKYDGDYGAMVGALSSGLGESDVINEDTNFEQWALTTSKQLGVDIPKNELQKVIKSVNKSTDHIFMKMEMFLELINNKLNMSENVDENYNKEIEKLKKTFSNTLKNLNGTLIEDPKVLWLDLGTELGLLSDKDIDKVATSLQWESLKEGKTEISKAIYNSTIAPQLTVIKETIENHKDKIDTKEATKLLSSLEYLFSTVVTESEYDDFIYKNIDVLKQCVKGLNGCKDKYKSLTEDKQKELDELLSKYNKTCTSKVKSWCEKTPLITDIVDFALVSKEDGTEPTEVLNAISDTCKFVEIV